MKITFLGQGLESESENAVGHCLVKYLISKDFYSFTAISAFASPFAISGLARHIEGAKKNLNGITIIVGIDQQGTSKEALEEILNLDVHGYIFYQSESVIFHPKIYLFEGEKEIKLIIGSSNLTGNGLFTNVESSVLIEFTTGDIDGKKLLNDFKGYYKKLLDFTDDNLFKITWDVIKNFELKGILPDELTTREKYWKNTDAENDDIPKRLTAKMPSTFNRTMESPTVNLDIDIEHLLIKVPNEIKILFQTLKKNIRSFDKNVEMGATAMYVSFKTSIIFAEVRLQKKSLRIVLRMINYSDFRDDVTLIPPSYGWGKKSIKIYINDNDKLARMMPLIKRSYDSTK